MFDGTPPCAADPAMFFSLNPARREQAKGVCATCPFSEPCRALSERPLEFADSSYAVRNGVWAGVDRREAPDEDRLSPKQRQTRDRTEQVRVFRSQNLKVTEIARRMGISHGSVNHIINTYLTTGD